jgi:hypothetical protein
MRAPTVALVFAAGLVASPALADGPGGRAACAVDIIHARADGDGSIDPQLAGLAEDLKKPPFTSWKTFKRIDRKDAQLAEGASASFGTPGGGSGSLTYAGHLQRGGGRHAIKVVLDVPGGASNTRSHFTIDEGGHMMVAGLKYQGGILIYAVSCRTDQ